MGGPFGYGNGYGYGYGLVLRCSDGLQEPMRELQLEVHSLRFCQKSTPVSGMTLRKRSEQDGAHLGVDQEPCEGVVADLALA